MTDDMIEEPISRTAAPGEPIVMIRSEERLTTRIEQVPARIARLEKYIVTEQRTITVDVRHEEARLVYDDLPGGRHALGSPALDPPTSDLSTDVNRRLPEFVLSEEQIEVRTVTVPVERVRLVIDSVIEQRQVDAAVRAERIVAEHTTLAG